MSQIIPNKSVSGFEAFNSEEFKAFASKFNISINPRTVEITIRMDRDKLLVTQSYLGVKPLPASEDKPMYSGFDGEGRE